MHSPVLEDVLDTLTDCSLSNGGDVPLCIRCTPQALEIFQLNCVTQ